MGLFFKIRISIGLCYTMRKQTTVFNLMLHFSEVYFLAFSIYAIWWFLFVRGYHSKLYNVVQLTSEWAKIERFQWTIHDWFRLNFSLSYDIARKDERNFSINVRINLTLHELPSRENDLCNITFFFFFFNSRTVF